jgi:hypothetical protein
MDPMSQYDRAVECQTWFRAVPVDEFVDRVIVRSMRTFRSEAVQDCCFRVSEIGNAI